MRYDFGNTNNLHYTGEVPDINVKNIRKVPIILYVGTNDTFSTVQDAFYLIKNVATVQKMYVVENFDHT